MSHRDDSNIDPVEPNDHLVVVRIHDEHWWQLVGDGMPVNGLVQLVLQPDQRYGMRIVQ